MNDYVRYYGRLYRITEINTDGTAWLRSVNGPLHVVLAALNDLVPTGLRSA